MYAPPKDGNDFCNYSPHHVEDIAGLGTFYVFKVQGGREQFVQTELYEATLNLKLRCTIDH